MARTSGASDFLVGLVDGPVATDLPAFAGRSIRTLPEGGNSFCHQDAGLACLHGTFVAAILAAVRGAAAPAICPNCTLLVRPIFSESTHPQGELPNATPADLALAIHECIGAGARVLNISAALAQPSTQSERALEGALDYAMQRGVLVVVAAGNQGTLGSTALTRHPWVIPVVAYDLQGRPMSESNLGSSIGRRGLGAPGDRITSIGADGRPLTLGGTSAATPFVTGTVALLWSEFPEATAVELRLALTRTSPPRRRTVVPPLLDAWGAYSVLAQARRA